MALGRYDAHVKAVRAHHPPGSIGRSHVWRERRCALLQHTKLTSRVSALCAVAGGWRAGAPQPVRGTQGDVDTRVAQRRAERAPLGRPSRSSCALSCLVVVACEMEWRVVSRDGRRARVAHRVTVVARVACRVTVVARVWRVCPRADARRPAQERTAAGAVITIVGLTMMVLLLLYEA